MTAYKGNNVVLAKNGLTVTISTDPTDKENLTKKLFLLTPPKTDAQQETDPENADYGPYATKILDLLSKAEQRITIKGYLVTGLGDSDSNSDAQSKKGDLKNIFLGGGACNMTYEGSTFTVGIEKLEIARVNTEGLAAADGEAEFSVQFTVIRGEDFGT